MVAADIEYDTLVRKEIEVGAGKTGMLVFSESAVAVDRKPVLVALESDIEGVDWWVIDEATPSVDEDTKLFGWLMDPAAPWYDHDHGFVSSTGHKNTTAMENYESLPCFVRYSRDPLLSTRRRLWAEDPTTAPLITHSGHSIKYLTADAPLDADLHHELILYFFGHQADQWANLGTPYDSLRFTHYGAVADKTKTGGLHMTLYNYPYTSLRRDYDALPALTPYGKTIWAVDDENLCMQAYFNDGPPYPAGLGWFSGSDGVSGDVLGQPHGCSAAFWRYFNTDANNPPADNPAYDGWAWYDMGAKANFYSKPSDSTLANCVFAADGDGQPVWSRVTMLMLGWMGSVKNVALGQNWSLNVWFGPAMGKLHTLRPYAAFDSNPWTTGSLPAIGIQNPTGRKATIRALFAGTEP
jgi:hypothetical protein